MDRMRKVAAARVLVQLARHTVVIGMMLLQLELELSEIELMMMMLMLMRMMRLVVLKAMVVVLRLLDGLSGCNSGCDGSGGGHRRQCDGLRLLRRTNRERASRLELDII